MTKLKFIGDILKFSNKFSFFDIFFFKYIKMSKYLSVKYYQKNKERLQKKLVKDIKIFLKKKKKKTTIWSSMLQKFLRRWKTEVCGV